MTIVLWHGQNQSAQKVFDKLTDEFNRTHPKIHVDAEVGAPADSLLEKVTAAQSRPAASTPTKWLSQPAQDARWDVEAGSLPLRASAAQQPAWKDHARQSMPARSCAPAAISCRFVLSAAAAFPARRAARAVPAAPRREGAASGRRAR